MNAPADRLSRLEKAGLVLFTVLIVGMGALTTIRSAYMANPKTDFQVYARAAWAVRAGWDIYAITDNNGWHYCYPPTFAVLLAPLADPYPFAPRDGYLPFAVSTAIWYVLSAGCAWLAVHLLAGAVLPGLPRGSRKWWYARTVPLYVCLAGIGFTLGRGQVNLQVVALVAAGFAAAVRNRQLASGAWLAAAAVLKIIPALLMAFPVMRRDGRALVGAIAAAVVLLGVIPAAVWGIPGMIEANRKTVNLVLAPVMSEDADQSRQRELHGMKATDSQSVRAVVQAWLYPDRDTRPDQPVPAARWAHLGASGLLLAVTLWVGLRRLTPAPADQLLFLGALCAVMTLATPVSHMHYYAFVLPLVCGLWLRGLAGRPDRVSAGRGVTTVLAVWGVCTALPMLPGPVFDQLRERGLGTAATIGLWAVGLAMIGRAPAAHAVPEATPVRQAA